MIWTASDTVSGQGHALCRHLESEIASAYRDAHPVPEHTGDVARGVAAYWSGLAEADALPSQYVALLVSRALHGVGEKHAARRVVEHHFPDHQGGDVVENAMRLKSLPPAVWNVFASRLLRPSRWAVGQGGVTWVLDLSRLELDAGGCLELSFLQALRALLHSVADIWNASGGEGILGLRGLSQAAGLVRSRRANALAGEAEDYCRSVLERLRASRGWRTAPHVVSLDIPRKSRRRQTGH